MQGAGRTADEDIVADMGVDVSVSASGGLCGRGGDITSVKTPRLGGFGDEDMSPPTPPL